MNYRNYLNQENPSVTLVIKDFGKIELELFYEVAPNTVSNFINLVENKATLPSTRQLFLPVLPERQARLWG